jgi:RHS repeat-associated protein
MNYISMKNLLVIIILLLCSVGSNLLNAQSINGPSNVNDQQIANYSLSLPITGRYNWKISGGTLISYTSTTCTVKWDGLMSNGKVEFQIYQYYPPLDAWGMVTQVSLAVNVYIPPPAPPNPPHPVEAGYSNPCGPKHITKVGTPPLGVTWYWRKELLVPVSEMIMYPAISDFQVNAAGRYYIFARDNSSGAWSEGYGFIDITIPNPVNAGSIAGSKTICYNGNAGTLTGTAASGGVGSYSYQWQKMVGSSSWQDISNTLSYSPGNLTVTTKFRRRVINQCDTKYSNVVTVTVRSILSAGAIGGGKTICHGSPSGSFNNISLAGGGSSSYSYQWQKKFSTGTWVNITNATGSSYSGGDIVTTQTQYRRATTDNNGCGTTYTNPVTVAVDPLSVGGNITGEVEFFGNGSGILTLNNKSGEVQKWIKRVSGGTWQDITNISTTLNYTNVGMTTEYQAEVKSGVCASASSTIATVTIYNIPVITNLGRDNITLNETTTLSTDGGYFAYQWSRNGINLTGKTSSALTATKPGDYAVWIQASVGGPTHTTQIYTIGSIMDQQTNLNYITSIDYLKEGVNESIDLYDLTRAEYSYSTQYFDGLGRPFQTVSLGSSPLGNDVVLPIEYDNLGRIVKDFLPYTTSSREGIYKADAIIEQYNFYQTTPNIAHDPSPYAEKVFEPSPLNRVLEQGAPGAAWQPVLDDPATTLIDESKNGKTIKYKYEINTLSDAVKIWDINITTGLPETTGDYPAGELYKNITTDEENDQVIEFTNKQGQTILKRVQVNELATEWADTYYIYDDFGNLRFVLPPEAVKEIGNPIIFPYSPAPTLLANWAFQYKYDGRRRMVEKKVPGAEPVYLVYDNRDRLVLTQDGNQRDPSTGSGVEWLFTKYDALNRPIATGIYKENLSREAMQQKVNETYLIQFDWSNITGVTQDKNLVTKTATAGWGGNGGSSHIDYLAANEDGVVYVRATETNKGRFFGFESGTITHLHNNLEYSIYLTATGTIQIRENNTIVFNSAIYSEGDLLAVERRAGTIYYWHNDIFLYTSNNPSSGSLSVDVAMNETGATLQFLPEFHEERGTAVFDYTNQSFPLQTNESDYLTITYYDNYNFHHASLPDYQYKTTVDNPGYFDRVKGQVTGSMVRILNTDQWLRSVNFYDDRYRIIQQVSDNAIEGIDRVTNQYDFVGKVLKTKTTHDTPNPILWTKKDEIAEENGIFKPITASGWGSGMSSVNKLPAGQDGFFKTVITDLTGYRFVGFNDKDEITSHTDIDYGIYFYGKSLRAYYQGTAQQTLGTLEMGDIIKLERASDIINLYQNNELVYSYTTYPSTTDLVIDISLYSNNGSVGYFSSNLPIPKAESPFPVYWQGLYLMTDGDNSLLKTGSGWNGNASSMNKLKSNEDGWLEFEAATADKALMIGLSENDLNASYNYLNYAIYLRGDSMINVYENGYSQGLFGSYQKGDVFKIERKGQDVQYSKNSLVFYTSLIPSTTPLIADASFNTLGASVANVKSSFFFDLPQENDIDITRTFDYDHAGRLINTWHNIAEDIVWKDASGMNVNGNSLTKTAVTGWNAGATSVNQLAEGEDGWVEMTATENNTYRMFGLATENINPHYSSIDYAIYPGATGLVYVYESGTQRGQFGPYFPGDKLKVERIGDKVNYIKNGVTLYTSLVLSNGLLVADVALYNTGCTITDARCSFSQKILLAHNEYNELGELIDKKLHSADGTTYAQSVDYRYNIRGWLTKINESDLTETEPDAAVDYFGMNLGYNEQLGVTATADLQFNGNISAVKWSKGIQQNATMGYEYQYDPMNRITKAQTNNATPNAFNLNAIGYDLNGNIESLTRMNETGVAMDELTYNYGATKSNQLMAVADGATVAGGFTDGTNPGDDYQYDPNGNMTKDLNKDIVKITYNHLNLPETVEKADGQRIRYTYDAAGVKLSQHVEIGNEVYASDFSSTNDGFILYGINAYTNQDGVFGKDDVLKLTAQTNGNLHRIYKILPVELKRTKVSVDVYIPSANTNIDGVMLQIGVTRQYLTIIPDQWQTVQFEAVASIDQVHLFQTSAGIYNFVGAGSATDDIIYIKDFVVTTFETKSTDYNGEFIYETDTEGIQSLALIQHEEGRIVPGLVPGSFEYQYYLKDHLGNTRVTFTTKPNTFNFNLFYEPDHDYVEVNGELVADDTDLLSATDQGNIELNNAMDHTDAFPAAIYQYAYLLNGNGNSRAGSVISIPVGMGDKVNAAVNVKLFNITATTVDAPAEVGSVVADAIRSGISLGAETVANSVSAGYGAGVLLGTAGFPVDATNKMVFLNMLFIPDNGLSTITGSELKYKQVTDADNKWELITLPEFEAPEAGYVVVYVSNESDTQLEAYFDDMKVTIAEHPVIQTDDYYPFGLSHSGGYQRVTAKENRFKYNGFEEQTELDWNVYDYQARYYDPAIGRFLNVDPAADYMRRHSPYNYAFDNPIRFIDPDGMMPSEVGKGPCGDKPCDEESKSSNTLTVDKGEYTTTHTGVTQTTDYSVPGVNGSMGFDYSSTEVVEERPYDVNGGKSIPSSIQTTDAEGNSITVNVSFYSGAGFSDKHSSNNKVSTKAADGYVKGVKKANNMGAGITSLTINATTNGRHSTSVPGPNWNNEDATSIHYVKNGGGAIDTGSVNGVRFAKQDSSMQATFQAAMDSVGARENFGPAFDHRNGATTSDKKHSWSHVSFK